MRYDAIRCDAVSSTGRVCAAAASYAHTRGKRKEREEEWKRGWEEREGGRGGRLLRQDNVSLGLDFGDEI